MADTFFVQLVNLSGILLVGLITGASSMITFEYGPTNVTVRQGHDAVFECTVRNKGRTAVRWYRFPDGTMISNDWHIDTNARPAIGEYLIEGDPNRGQLNLKITNVQAQDQGEYVCTFEAMSFQLLGAYLKVLVPPNDGYPRCEQTFPVGDAVAGDDVQLTCMSHGGSPPAVLTWKSGNRNLTDMRQSINYLRTQLTINEYGLNPVFTCSAESPALSSPRTCSINIQLVEPSVNIRPLAATRFVGQSATFMCTRVDKRSDNRFKWRYNHVDVDLSSSNRFNVSSDNRAFTINRVEEADNAAVIECVVTTLPDLSASGMLTVLLITGASVESSKPHTLKTEHSTLPGTVYNATDVEVSTADASGMVASTNGQTTRDATPMIIVLGAGGGLVIVVLALVVNCMLRKRSKQTSNEPTGSIKTVSSGVSLVSKKDPEQPVPNAEPPKASTPCKKEINVDSTTNKAAKPTSPYLELDKTGVRLSEYQGLNAPPISIYAEPNINVPPSRIVPRPQHQESFHDYAFPDEYVEPDPPPRNKKGKEGKETKQNADGLYIEIIA